MIPTSFLPNAPMDKASLELVSEDNCVVAGCTEYLLIQTFFLPSDPMDKASLEDSCSDLLSADGLVTDSNFSDDNASPGCLTDLSSIGLSLLAGNGKVCAILVEDVIGDSVLEYSDNNTFLKYSSSVGLPLLVGSGKVCALLIGGGELHITSNDDSAMLQLDESLG